MKNSILNKILKLGIIIRRVIYVIFYFVDIKLLKKKNLITILCYHSIANNSWKFSVSLKDFKRQIKFLKNAGYKFVTLEDIKEYVQDNKKINQPSVVITFDDGYAGLVEVADFLRNDNILPTVFVLSDTKNPNRNELGNNQSFLNKKEIMFLIKHGWEIGSHTATHSNLAQISKHQLEDEIIGSKKTLEKELGVKIRYLSFPRGKYDESTLKVMKKAGYELGLTMDDDIITKSSNLFFLPRIGINGTHNFLEFKGTLTTLAIRFRRLAKKTMFGTII